MTKKRFAAEDALTHGAGVEEQAEEKGAKRKEYIRDTVEAIAIALVLALIIRTFLVQAFKIPSGSMEDTLLVGDHILVSKFSYGLQIPKPAMIKVFGVTVPFFSTELKPLWGEIQRGDVAVFRYPEDMTKDFIKRVVAVGGDEIEVRKKKVYVNGEQVDEPYAVFKGGVPSDSDRADNFGPYVVPEDHILAFGDNRDRSYDSRFWGPVDIKNLRGRAFTIYWSRDPNRKFPRGIRFKRFLDKIS
jgi:signal peptidase I